MRILVIGKYPPILGGVSSQTYFTCKSLAERGHQVYIVTNGLECEPSLRSCPLANRNGDSVSSANPCVIDISALANFAYVPWASPFLSRIIGASLRVVREESIDLIVGWYFEPFGLAAAIVGAVSGVPYLLRHAGSDLGKLSKNADLCESYRFATAGAAAMITSGGSSEVLDKLVNILGAKPERVVTLHNCQLPSEFRRSRQNCSGTAPKVNSLINRVTWFEDLQLEDDTKSWLKQTHSNYRQGLPTIAIFGKVGKTKGTWDLISALENLPDSIAYNFVCMSGGKPDDYGQFAKRLQDTSRLCSRVVVLPPCPPWLVGEMLASVDAVCCLEYNFPVSIHAPRIPREVLASGACLVISSEIADKQPYGNSLVHGKNCYIVKNPGDLDELTNVLASVLTQQENLRIVAKHGWYLSKTCESFMHEQDSMADAICDIGDELTNGHGVPCVVF